MNRTAMPPPLPLSGSERPPVGRAAPWRRHAGRGIGLLALAGCAGLLWQSPQSNYLAAGLGLAAGWLLGRPWQGASAAAQAHAAAHASNRAAAPTAPATGRSHSAGRQGTEVMVTQVVPVWSRQLGLTRDAADAGMQKLLNSFSVMSSALDEMLTSLQGQGAITSASGTDCAFDDQLEALAPLLAPMKRAFDQRNEAVRALADTAEGLREMRQLAKQAREVARHTRLVAFNASIEAQRGQANDKGSQAVATEVRMLAGRIAEISDQLERTLIALQKPLHLARLDGEVHDTTAEELKLEIEAQARVALSRMLDALGTSITGSALVQQASATMREELDQTFTHFQFGDRLNQMLDILGDDMTRFAHWVSTHPHATQSDAADWLAALESRYTMDEQRSQHHGNVHIERASEVEFF